MSEGFFVNTSRLTGCFNCVSSLENRLDLFQIQDCLAVLGGESVAWSQIIKIQKWWNPMAYRGLGTWWLLLVLPFTLWRCGFVNASKSTQNWELRIGPLPKVVWHCMDVAQGVTPILPGLQPGHWLVGLLEFIQHTCVWYASWKTEASLFPVQKSGYPDDMENIMLFFIRFHICPYRLKYFIKTCRLKAQV